MSSALTTYKSQSSPLATEFIHMSPNTGLRNYVHDNLNQIQTISDGGKIAIVGNTNRSFDSVDVGSNPALAKGPKEFEGNTVLESPNDLLAISGSVGTVTDQIDSQVNFRDYPDRAFVYDLNGNMVSDGNLNYKFDADDRLVEIIYPGVGNKTQFIYDASGIIASTRELHNNIALSDIKYILCGPDRIVQIAAGGEITQFFACGRRISNVNWFYFQDHQLSIRTLCNESESQMQFFDYDAFGKSNHIDDYFGYHGLAVHQRSQLLIASFRFYNPKLGVWISRDPAVSNTNLYNFVSNDPLNYTDRLGLWDMGEFAAGAQQAQQAARSMGPGTAAAAGAVALTLATAALLYDKSNKRKPVSKQCDDDDCNTIRRKIYYTMSELQSRMTDLNNDPERLFLMPSYKDIGTWTGHQDAFRQAQEKLKKLIDDAILKNCPFPKAAWDWAYSRKPPEKPAWAR